MKKFLLSLSILFFIVSPALASYTCGEDGGVIKNVIEETAVTACVSQLGADSQSQCVAIQCALERALSRPDTKQEWWNPTLGTFSKKVFDSPKEEIFGERYTYAQVNWIINSIFTLLLPRANKMQDIIDLVTIIKNLETGQIPSQLQPVADIISFPFTHPIASAKDQLKITLARLQIAPPVSAQGLGYAKLQGSANINTLWMATRNMAYLISIILLIAAGFMAMFRTKINPQTVVSIQMIIPKLAMSLILITFSLAIVGFVIDMIYVFIVAILGLIAVTGVSLPASLAGNITTLTTAATNYIGGVFLWWYVTLTISIVVLMIILQIGNIGGITGLVYALLGALLALLIWAVISIVRIIVTLFHAYLNLIILTITGPLQIMMDIVPADHKSGFVPWFKCVVGNASVFVITAVLLIFAVILFGLGGAPWNPTNLSFFTTGLNPGFTLPFLGGTEWILGDITHFGGSGAGWILRTLLLPMAFFSAMPGLMVMIRDTLCKTADPAGEIANAVRDAIKSATSGKPMESGKGVNLGSPIGAAAGKVGAGIVGLFRCLGKSTPISTPSGHVAVDKLKSGDVIWTFSSTGKRTGTIILIAKKTPVFNHKILQITTDTGCELSVSPLHPLPNGSPISSLVPGQIVNGVKISTIKLVEYTKKYVYDILPEGKTGYYEASGLILASTLKK